MLITEKGEQYSYADAETQSAKIANYLMALNLEQGARITVQIEKSPQSLWLYLAVLRCGLVYHPLNTAYTLDELNYFIGNAKPSVIICDSSRYSDYSYLCETQHIDHLLTLNVDGNGSLIDAINHQPISFDTVTVKSDDTALLLYSSGTTGKPKGIMLTHNNMIENAKVLVEHWDFTEQDCLLHALPIYHLHGLFVAISCVLMSGSSMRWLARFDVDEVMQQLPHCSVMMGVPTYYTRLLANDDFNRGITDSVRLFISGSAPLLIATFEAFEQRTGQTIVERYGMSETGMNTSNPYRLEQGARRAGTVGTALSGVSIKVVTDKFKNCAPNEIGAILIKGPNVFKGYWNMPEKTVAGFTDDGFFITGDCGFLDDENYLTIAGREKDMIICGGLNVYPKEIELLLDEHSDVIESAVIGLPHSDFGEVVAAVVVKQQYSTLTEHELIAFARQRLANFKVPKQVFFVGQLPRNAMSKVQKALLRETYLF